MSFDVYGILFFGISPSKVSFEEEAIIDLERVILGNEIPDGSISLYEKEDKILEKLPDYINLDYYNNSIKRIPYLYILGFQFTTRESAVSVPIRKINPDDEFISILADLANKLKWCPPNWYLVSYISC